MSKPHVWVVEMKEGREWSACASASLTQWDALHDRQRWREDNPDDQFRVAKYVRVEPKKRSKK